MEENKPLPEVLDVSLLKADYRCPHCATVLHGMVNYYKHVAFYHDASRPLKGKKARRAPLASELRDAMNSAKAGVARAARAMGVSTSYFKKWARILIPDELAEYKTRPLVGVGMTKGSIDVTRLPAYRKAQAVLAGTEQAPRAWKLYPHQRLAQLQRYGLLPDACMQCGFNEHRISDYKSPMLMDFLDGDQSNWLESNLRILCYNCYFLTVHDLWGKSKTSALGPASASH